MAEKFYSYYTIGKIGQSEICFPEDMIWCKYCARRYKRDNMALPKCVVLDRNIYDETTRWADCPINFDGTIRGTKRNDDYEELRRAAH